MFFLVSVLKERERKKKIRKNTALQMFNWVLNTPLAMVGNVEKKKKKVIKFTLETSRKKLLLNSEAYLEPSRTSAIELFFQN